MNLISLLLLLSSVAIQNAASYKYLVATPAVIKSLNGLISSVVYALADAGHDVTFVTPFPLAKQHPKITLFQSPSTEYFHRDANIFASQSVDEMYKYINSLSFQNADLFWKDPKMRSLLKTVHDYDAYVTMSYMNEYMFPLLDNYTGPLVQICTPGVELFSLTREGNWLPPSVVPAIFLNLDDHMSFWERAVNLPMMIYMYHNQPKFMTGMLEAVQRHFPHIEDFLSYYDRVALTLINGHFALDGPVPLLPSQVEIGTINAKKPQPLPKDLEEFMSGSGKAGVIYFSLGSIAKSSDIPQKAKEMFVEAFSKVPQRVLWKYEGTDLQLPPNVKTQGWMPQQDILGHPKTRVFVSHCGNLGTQEAKYHGVPVLGVPIAFDQPRNAARMERKGYAIVLQWEDLTTDKIVDALNKLINDTTYQERLDTVSRVLQDQKDTPAERAVWWLEYIVRHKGAPHLQYAGRRLSLFQYIMLDVILFWTAVLLVIILSFVYTVKCICCRKKGKTEAIQSRKKKQ